MSFHEFLARLGLHLIPGWPGRAPTKAQAKAQAEQFIHCPPRKANPDAEEDGGGAPVRAKWPSPLHCPCC